MCVYIYTHTHHVIYTIYNTHTLYTHTIEYYLPAGVQLRQDPGGTLRMNGIGEGRHVRPALMVPSLRGRERERERVTRPGVQQSGKSLFFIIAFIF